MRSATIMAGLLAGMVLGLAVVPAASAWGIGKDGGDAFIQTCMGNSPLPQVCERYVGDVFGFTDAIYGNIEKPADYEELMDLVYDTAQENYDRAQFGLGMGMGSFWTTANFCLYVIVDLARPITVWDKCYKWT